MYDYLAKIILLGPSGCGKSCILHRFVKDECMLKVPQSLPANFLGRILTSQTIGVEFASKIVKVGTGSRRKRIKLQLWDTAGTERFRSVSRSYYRGAAGAVLVYDISNTATMRALPTFLYDARQLASPHLTVALAGNKLDVDEQGRPGMPSLIDVDAPVGSVEERDRLRSASVSTKASEATLRGAGGLGSQNTYTVAPEGREVGAEDGNEWASSHNIKLAVEVSAYNGDGVEELFNRLAQMILTRIELGEIDPDDPQSGIQYGDASWGYEDGASVRSGVSSAFGGRRKRGASSAWTGMRDWEAAFGLNGRQSRCNC